MAKRKQPVTEVYIGGIKYDVRYENDLKQAGVELNGNYRRDTRQIEMRLNNPPGVRRRTLIHEILHGILAQTGNSLAGGNDKEEKLVVALAFGLESVTVDGKPLIRKVG